MLGVAVLDVQMLRGFDVWWLTLVRLLVLVWHIFVNDFRVFVMLFQFLKVSRSFDDLLLQCDNFKTPGIEPARNPQGFREEAGQATCRLCSERRKTKNTSGKVVHSIYT